MYFQTTLLNALCLLEIAEKFVHTLMNKMFRIMPKTEIISHDLNRVHRSCSLYTKTSETLCVHV